MVREAGLAGLTEGWLIVACGRFSPHYVCHYIGEPLASGRRRSHRQSVSRAAVFASQDVACLLAGRLNEEANKDITHQVLSLADAAVAMMELE